MAVKLSRQEFVQNLSDSGLIPLDELAAMLDALPGRPTEDGEALTDRLVAAGKITAFQAAAVRERDFSRLVIGNYQVLDRLGAGGMGTVFKARHRRMKRVVAIKVLAANVAQSKQFVQRFQREVEAVARLQHPNIVMAFDADEAEAGHFLVMEFVNGRDLASVVQHGGPLPVAEAVNCVVQAARALDYAHGQGIIHRDIKPANLLRDAAGVVKVADLGLARFNDTLGQPAEGAGSLTQAGTIMGTVDFMPPEQALGLTTVDYRADVYSLGCTLYFLLTGQAPFEAPTLMATLLKHREAPIPSLSAARGDVPAALDRVFQRMVAKKPEDRFPTMADVVAALEAVPLDSGSPVSPPVPIKPLVGPALTREAAPVSPAGQTVELDPAGQTGTALTPVLLVEPSRTQAVIIRGYLQKLGFQDIPTVPSGAGALEAARASPPGVVISALHLADMTGVRLAQEMANDPALASTHFVLITSQAESEEAHFQGVSPRVVRLHKPFDLDGLLAALGAAANLSPGEKTRSLKVLVVDDSAVARARARQVLSGFGLSRITEARDGAEAVEVLQREAFDLVVTDYNMPRLDGRGLVEFLRSHGPTAGVPVIVVTTETDPAKLEAVRRLGVSAICDKSFNPEAVRAVLARLG